MGFTGVINILVCIAIATVFAYKVAIIWRYRKLDHVTAAVIVRGERANCVDLAVFLVFALNSSVRTLAGFAQIDWNTIAAEAAIFLRLISLLFTFEATLFSDRKFHQSSQEIQKLVDEAAEYALRDRDNV